MAIPITRVLSARASATSTPPDERICAAIVASPGPFDPKDADGSSLYTFCVSEPLPQVDLATPLIRRLLSPPSYKCCLLFMRKHFGKFALIYRFGAVPSFIALFFVRNTAIRAALSVTVIACSSSIVTSGLFLSADLLALLAHNYEFWFLVAINALNWLIVASIFNDIRALACVSTWFGLQTVIFMDANYRTYPNTIYSTTVSTPVVLIIAGLVGAQLVADADYFAIQIQTRVVGNAADLIAFSTVTLVLFLIRILHLRRTIAKQDKRAMKTIPCVILRATLCLQPLLNTDPIPQSPFPDMATASNLRRTKQRLVLASLPLGQIDGNRTLLPSRIWQHPPPWTRIHADRLRGALYLTGGIAIFLLQADSLGSFYATWQALASGGSLEDGVLPSYSHFDLQIAISSGILTTIFCGTFMLFYQRDLTLLLLHDFDFLFSSLQTLVFVVCMCDMHHWDVHRSITVATWFVWFLWVLSLDALTPSVNDRLFRLRKRWTAPLFASFIGTIGATGLMVLFMPGLNLHNRVVWHHRFSTGVEFTVQTQAVLLGRALTICLWCTRQAFVRLTRREDELILIRGRVAYRSGLSTFPWRSKREIPGVNASSGRNTSHSVVFPLPLALRRLTAGQVQPLGIHGGG